MVIGDPVEHSLSPQIHNAGYKKLGLDFVCVASRVKEENLEDFIKGVRAMDIHGVSVTLPHKINIMQYLDDFDEAAQKIGAVNTIVNDNGVLKGYNTDYLGVLHPLEKITSLDGKTVALIGAGGAARAVAYAVTRKGATVTIYNRTLENAEKLAHDFDGQAFSRDAIEEARSADIIINTTSLGLHPHEDETPLSKEFIRDTHIIFDLVYTEHGATKLIEEAKEKGAKTISGIEMLLYQGSEQFKLYTGYDAPIETMKNTLM